MMELLKKYETLVIVHKCKTLVENLVNSDIEVDTPVFPEPHHLGLVHGMEHFIIYILVAKDIAKS